MASGEDRLFAAPRDPLLKFTFDEQVAGVFRDMIERSVPGYATTLSMIGVLAARYGRPGTVCYDLGCSLGAGAMAMHRHLKSKDIPIIAVDNSPAMIERASKLEMPGRDVRWLCRDIRDIEIVRASVVVLNFTLQFLNPADRGRLLKKIFSGLLPGGILILSEKIKFADEQENARQIDWYHSFKAANGYSEMEIAQKRNALEDVLIPETPETHHRRLAEAGFASSHVWFQCFNFISIIAEKADVELG